MQLRDAVVLVTGASSGVGRASAELLAARGARVVAAGRDGAALAELAARTGAVPVTVDLADPAAAVGLVDRAVALHGRLDALVAAAGVGLAGSLSRTAPERVAEVIDVDLRAPLLLVTRALPVMRRQGGGAVVLVSSVAGAVGVPGETVYSAAKAGLSTFATVAREELRGTGISVCDVVPGVVDTRFFTRRGIGYARRIPRPVPPQRVAQAVLRAVETGVARQVVPRWLHLPARLSATVPRSYRALARRLDPG